MQKSSSQKERAEKIIELMQKVINDEIELDGDVIISWYFKKPVYKSQKEIYQELYKKHYDGWENIDSKEKREVAERISNIHAVQNTVKEWRKQYA